jgi:hypothetical protein
VCMVAVPTLTLEWCRNNYTGMNYRGETISTRKEIETNKKKYCVMFVES